MELFILFSVCRTHSGIVEFLFIFPACGTRSGIVEVRVILFYILKILVEVI